MVINFPLELKQFSAMHIREQRRCSILSILSSTMSPATFHCIVKPANFILFSHIQNYELLFSNASIRNNLIQRSILYSIILSINYNMYHKRFSIQNHFHPPPNTMLNES